MSKRHSFSVTAFTSWLALGLVFTLVIAPSASAEKKKKGKKGEEEAAMEEQESANFRCEADVFYIWKRTPRMKTTTDKDGKVVLAEPPLDEKLLEPIEVFYSRPGETAESEAAAGQRLDAQLPEVQSQARAMCEKSHQSESRCVMARLRETSKDYRMLDFRARKQFLDTVAEDCRKNVGVCVSTKVGKTHCEKEEAGGKAGDNAGGEEEKDSKKKKKKK